MSTCLPSGNKQNVNVNKYFGFSCTTLNISQSFLFLSLPLTNSRTYNMVRIFGWSDLSFFLFAHARIIDNRKLNQGGENTGKRYDHK